MGERALPNIERLHHEALERLKAGAEGRGAKGFGALLDAARYMAIVDVCAALRKDLVARARGEGER